MPGSLQRHHHATPVTGRPAFELHESARAFGSPDGERWVVAELPDPPVAPGVPGGRSLVFACEHAWRRVHDYPADWRSLDAAALWELSWRR